MIFLVNQRCQVVVFTKHLKGNGSISNVGSLIPLFTNHYKDYVFVTLLTSCEEEIYFK